MKIVQAAAGAAASVFVKHLLTQTVSKSTHGALEVTFEDGRYRILGQRGQPIVAKLRIKSPEVYRRILQSGEIAVGETYMDGLWETDDLAGLLAFAIRCRDDLPKVSARINALSRIKDRRLHLSHSNTMAGSASNIHAHYDLSNELFRLFLDETMTYSCALFESSDQPLEDAQRNKYEALCRKAEIKASDHVLEIGSGWGGFAIYAAQTYGCRVTTITISREQLELARKRVAQAGLSDKVKVEYCDYRDVPGRFNKIVSIEMFEAVGAEYFADFFEKCSSVLYPGGLIALQTIAFPDRSFADQLNGVNWVQKYIFPGGTLPSLSQLENAVRNTTLIVTNVEDIGPHYVTTLRTWRESFFANLDKVRALGGFDDRFIRMWEYYLCYSEAGFATRNIVDYQVVFEKVIK